MKLCLIQWWVPHCCQVYQFSVIKGIFFLNGTPYILYHFRILRWKLNTFCITNHISKFSRFRNIDVWTLKIRNIYAAVKTKRFWLKRNGLHFRISVFYELSLDAIFRFNQKCQFFDRKSERTHYKQNRCFQTSIFRKRLNLEI